MIAIVDYGVGNLFSLTSSFKAIGIEAVATGDEKIIKNAEKIILPGVGAFSDAAAKLRQSGLDELVCERAKAGVPMLGICLGMQLLFEKSYEYGEHEGLGLIPGAVIPMKGKIADDLKIPHIGWNPLSFPKNREKSVLYRDLNEGDDMALPWKTYVGWMKPEGSGQSLDFEISGTVSGLFKKGIANDKIYNDVGNTAAFLWTDSGSEVRVYSGYNRISKENHGFLGNGALMFIGRSVDWYEWGPDGNVCGSKAFYISFNASKLKGGTAQLNFEWSAGTQDGNKSWFYPIDWKVECSADGKNWHLLKENTTGGQAVMLHNVPWGNCVVKGSGHDFKKRPNYDTAMGPQQHSYMLPAEVLGQKNVILRLSPSSADVAKVRVEPVSPYRNGQITPADTDRQTWIRFESLQIDYKK